MSTPASSEPSTNQRGRDRSSDPPSPSPRNRDKLRGITSARRHKTPRVKLVSEPLRQELLNLRRKMIKTGVVYEAEYFSEPLTPHNSTLMKPYLITIGEPGDKDAKPKKKKSVSAHVGASADTTYDRVNYHNNPTAEVKNPKTRDGCMRWVLCMTLYVPAMWHIAELSSTRAIRDYWGLAHGCDGKIKRGWEIANMFNLQYSIPDEHRAYVMALRDKSKTYGPWDSDLFRPMEAPVGEVRPQSADEEEEKRLGA
jgi:hypothetical protein